LYVGETVSVFPSAVPGSNLTLKATKGTAMTDERTSDANAAPPLNVRKGVCFALYAFDVGMSIDLEKCKKQVTADMHDAIVRHNRRAPKYFDYRPAPLLITRDITPCEIGGFRTTADVDILLYDFGGVSISYEIPFTGSWETMLAISCGLSESNVLLTDAQRRVEALLKAVGLAVTKPHIADMVEDYAVFQIDEYECPVEPDQLHARYASELAQVLRAERGRLSEQEMNDAVSVRLSFSRDDVSLIDWNAAILFDREAADVRAVLEFANVELLEMRYLDHQLDDALDRSYEMLAVHKWFSELVPGLSGSTVRRISQMQLEGALLFERVSNAPKLLGDQYLARVYRLTSQRFHLAEWNAGILRKLDAIESIYKQMHDRAASRRLEVLEWVIIVLIAFELVIPFLPK